MEAQFIYHLISNTNTRENNIGRSQTQEPYVAQIIIYHLNKKTHTHTHTHTNQNNGWWRFSSAPFYACCSANLGEQIATASPTLRKMLSSPISSANLEAWSFSVTTGPGFASINWSMSNQLIDQINHSHWVIVSESILTTTTKLIYTISFCLKLYHEFRYIFATLRGLYSI